MDWIKKNPERPGYYFLRDYGEEYMVEVFITRDGPMFFEFPSLNIVSCFDLPDAEWLGPITSVDIVNLWKDFERER